MHQKFTAFESIRQLRGPHDDSESNDTYPKKPWRPVTLRISYLASLVIATAGLIAVIQYLLFLSRRDGGIIFAPDINALPLKRSFCYLYLPTLISVIYSFLWTWVDLDIKRLEPYFQLSKPGGATGAGSILLSYPLEFLVTLPFLAFKKGHWVVLLASTAMILIFWGLTPTQAGIFANRTINITSPMMSFYATNYTPVAQQGKLSAEYAQSVYNIAWLNETLPPFMTKQFVLDRFGPMTESYPQSSSMTYTARTMLYSLDISCEEAVLWEEGNSYNTSQGCSFYAPSYRPIGNNDTSKPYDTMYVGYQNQNGGADYYLSSACNKSFFHSFFIRWSRSTPSAIMSGDESSSASLSFGNATSLFCEPQYYQQEVNATISLPSQAVLGVQVVSDQRPLAPDMFDTKSFEWEMSAAMETSARLDFPTTTFPDQKSHLLDMPLNLAYLPKMAPFAIATNFQPAENYLDPEVLRASYESAYRLLFARRLLDTLGGDLNVSTTNTGHLTYITEAVVVVPGFAYVATILLGIVLVFGVALFFILPRRANCLAYDPSTLGRLMCLLSGDPSTLGMLADLNNVSDLRVSAALGERAFLLECRDSDSCLKYLPQNLDPRNMDEEDSQPKEPDISGIRPTEMKLVPGVIFLVLQLSAIVCFGVLFVQSSRSQGLSLPSQSTFIRQLVENYVPILFATFVEPYWLVLNRLLGLLQPFDELRKGKAMASRAVDLDYNSLPPQMLLVRACRARHFTLALVCFMVLSANMLAVALSGLMYEDTSLIAHSSTFALVSEPRFESLNGTGFPFNANASGNWQGGTTMDQFYHEESNLTANTPLPPWTDMQFAYMPIELSATNVTAILQYNSPAFGVSLGCAPLPEESYSLIWNEDASNATFKVYLANNDGSTTTCGKPDLTEAFSFVQSPQTGRVALEMAFMLAASNGAQEEDLFCRQHYFAGWFRYDWQETSGMTLHALPKMKAVSQNSTVLICKPTLLFGQATIEVDSTGRVQNRSEITLLSNDSDLSGYFTTTPEDLIAQANMFLTDPGATPTWHKDDYPSDYMNYLIKKSTNDSTLLDYSLPPPDPDHAAAQLGQMYQKLFAILIGSNVNRLLLPVANDNKVEGQTILPETRIMFSTPAFIITEVILLMYMLTTIILYVRRPWRILPRMPSTVASNLIFIAGSTAFEEQKEQQRCGATFDDLRKARESWTWGYGTFVGSDGERHVGIEREPLVQVLREEKLPLR